MRSKHRLLSRVSHIIIRGHYLSINSHPFERRTLLSQKKTLSQFLSSHFNVEGTSNLLCEFDVPRPSCGSNLMPHDFGIERVASNINSLHKQGYLHLFGFYMHYQEKAGLSIKSRGSPPKSATNTVSSCDNVCSLA